MADQDSITLTRAQIEELRAIIHNADSPLGNRLQDVSSRLYFALHDGGWTPAAKAVEPEGTCRVCGVARASHGSYPTCASHPYTPDENCRHVIGARCLGAECNAKVCVRGVALPSSPSSAPAESGWQPIETAPKDGTLIVLGARNGVWLGKYVPVYTSGFRPENPWASMLLNHDHMAERYTRPTHWMPLLAAPQAVQAGGEGGRG